MHSPVLLARLHPPEEEQEGIPVELPPPPEGLLLSGFLLQVIIKLRQMLQPSHTQAPGAKGSPSHAAAEQMSGPLDMGNC